MKHQTKSNSVALILKASAIMGSSSLVAVLSGMLKNKVVAVLLGPAGVGLFGLMQSVQATAATLAGMGVSASGIRQVSSAYAAEDPSDFNIVRRALWLASICLGLVCGIVLLVFREQIGRVAIGHEGYGGAVAWIGIGVWATVASGAQTSILNGMRWIRELALVNSAGAILGMIVAMATVWIWGESGVVAAVISAPVATLMVSSWMSRRIPVSGDTVRWPEMAEPLKNLFKLGFALMASGLVTAGTQLAVRAFLARTLGVDAAGHFQAAWGVSMSYLGIVLGAMGADYLPRLTAESGNDDATNRLINEQLEVALLLTGPVILAMIAFAPQVVTLLYSGGFTDTISVLRWQILGDLFKVVSWPLGFILLARGAGRLFFLTELLWNLAYFGVLSFGLKRWGLDSAGIAFVVAYLFLFIVNMYLAHRLSNYRVPQDFWITFSVVLGASVIVLWAGNTHIPGAAYISLLLIAVVSAVSYLRLYRYYRKHKAAPE